MARLFIDGFETGSLAWWNETDQASVSSTQAGRTGAYCAYLNGAATGTRRLIKYLAVSKSELYIAFKINPKTMGTAKCLVTFWDATGSLGSVKTDATVNTKVCAYIGTSTTLLGTGDETKLDTGAWTLIEVYYKPHETDGVFQVKVDGVLDVDVSGTATAPRTSNITKVSFSKNVDAYGLDAFFDDIVFDDAEWIGNTYIQKLQPTGAGTTTQWDPSTGDNYACVDEIPPVDTDYVSTNVTNEIDTYACGDMTGVVGLIHCVQLQGRIAYAGAPTPTKVQLGVRSGGSDYFDTDMTPGLSFTAVLKILEVDPATSVAWTESGVNDVEIGVKATA